MDLFNHYCMLKRTCQLEPCEKEYYYVYPESLIHAWQSLSVIFAHAAVMTSSITLGVTVSCKSASFAFINA